MAFPTTSHSTNAAAQTDLVNQLIAAGYTPNASLDLTSILFSAVANLLQSLPNSSGVRIYTATVNPASVAAATTAEQAFTVTGVTTADVIVVNKPTVTAGLGIAGARASAANEVTITFVNATAGAIDAASETYTFLAVRE